MDVIRKIKDLRLQAILAYARTKPIQNRKVLFWSDLGHRYSCNPRYLSEYMKVHYPEKYDIVWMFDQSAVIPDNFPKDIRTVRYFSIEWLYEITTAKYIVCNHRIPNHFFFKKRAGQIYVQTWHSSLRLKSIEKDAASALGESYIATAQADSSQIDYIVSGCRFSSKIYSNSFWYDGKILECGTPRIDYLLNQSKDKISLFKNAGLDASFRYALYAPTFRKGDSLDAYDIDMERLAETLKKRFGGQWKILYRLHPNLANRIKMDALPSCCIDMTKYHDMQELLVLSDVLITDYSSSMFDVAYLKKLCILYVSDLERYVQNERRLYFNIPDLPFLIAQNNNELEEKICKFDEQEYLGQLKQFMSEIGSFENGNSCEQIVKTIMS